MAKTASRTVKESENRRGITSTSVKLDPEERELWDRMAALHGGRKASLVCALQLLAGQNATDWPAELRRLAAEMERDTARKP